MSDRKLVTLREISAIKPIEKADAIEVAVIDGWEVVVKKGQFKPGDNCIYFEIDSWVPEHVAPFMYKGREFNGVKGECLRTVKMRGQISQGLALPVPDGFTHLEHGIDLSDYFGVIKYEKPSVSESVKCSFPSDIIPKTDQERAQNILCDIKNAFDQRHHFESTIKLDGSSITVYYKDGEVNVCSRNNTLHLTDDNLFVKTARSTGLIDALEKIGFNIAVQGELMGPNVQGNREKLDHHTIFVFDIYDIDEKQYCTRLMRMTYMDMLKANGFKGEHVPIIDVGHLPACDIDGLLNYADGKSLNHTVREGVVFKSIDGGFSFKVINNKFLLSEKLRYDSYRSSRVLTPMNSVFVISSTKEPLMPCSTARARKLLTAGRAAVYRLQPFTIILKDRDDGETQPIEVEEQ